MYLFNQTVFSLIKSYYLLFYRALHWPRSPCFCGA